MKKRLPAMRSVSASRTTFISRLVGTSSGGTHIRALKEHLHVAGLTDCPVKQLDLVMVEDLDHFYDLLGEAGVPLALNDADVPDPDIVTLHRSVLRKLLWIAWLSPGPIGAYVFLLDIFDWLPG